MYAIIADGGRQYKVEAGNELELDYRESVTGDQLTFDRVLALNGPDGMVVGTPHVAGAVVKAEVLGVAFGKKLLVQKFRRRKTFRRKNGHRQMHTLVKIQSILPNG
jgi:large subunit ribosomal protein L21